MTVIIKIIIELDVIDGKPPALHLGPQPLPLLSSILGQISTSSPFGID